METFYVLLIIVIRHDKVHICTLISSLISSLCANLDIAYIYLEEKHLLAQKVMKNWKKKLSELFYATEKVDNTLGFL